jgi:type VI secretion system secreted protein Hcp
MSVNAYLVLEGIEGPSTSKKGAIDILSFTFSAEKTTVISQSSGSESKSGKAEVSGITVAKVLDKTSPHLFLHCVSGKTITKATLFYDKPIGTEQKDYFKIEMQNAVVSSIEFKGSSEHPGEEVYIAAERVKVGYNPEADGKLQGYIEKGYDLKTLKPF